MKKTPEDLADLFLRVLLGFVAGAFVGATVGVFCAAIYILGAPLMFHEIDFDSGLAALPLISARFGAIAVAAFGVIFAVRRR